MWGGTRKSGDRGSCGWNIIYERRMIFIKERNAFIGKLQEGQVSFTIPSRFLKQNLPLQYDGLNSIMERRQP